MKALSLQFDSNDAKKLAIGSTVLVAHFRVIVNEYAGEMVSEAESDLNRIAAIHTNTIMKHLNNNIPEIKERLDQLRRSYDAEKRMKATEKYEEQLLQFRRATGSTDILPINLSQRIEEVLEPEEPIVVSNEQKVMVAELLLGLKDIVKNSFQRFKNKMKTVLKLSTLQKAVLQELPPPNIDEDIDFIIKVLNKV